MTAYYKTLADPVHGTIGLSKLEAQIISTRAFQRLRQVKQLGLAHMVFPGADYSRFAHSLGVCHVTGRILSALQRKGVPLSDDDVKRYRLAGLLHDVGHYPFSHAMEEALKNFFARKMLEETGERPINGASESAADGHFLDHEYVGTATIEGDAEIADHLKANGVEPVQVHSIFTRNDPPRFANLVSSDLDADRIDYLLRTSHHTGLPYGAIDLEYLLTQLHVDRDTHICVHPKALRAVEHFLLARYFDYQQVSYHKTVAGLELVLKDVLRALLDTGRLELSSADIKRQIADGSWCDIDDVLVTRMISELNRETSDDALRQKASAILQRRPPKLVASIERLESRDPSEKRRFIGEIKQVNEHVKQWAETFGVPSELWYVWDKPGQVLTKIGSRVPVTFVEHDADEDSKDKEKAEQLVRIYDPHDNTSEPIVQHERSLMRLLANQALYTLRVYVILPDGNDTLRNRIEAHIRQDLPHFWE